MTESSNNEGPEQYAVIGIACRFPGARDLAAFWQNLASGRESIQREPYENHEVTARGVLDGAEFFDAEHFGYSPREAQLMDPQQRLLLECSWEALEDAGHAPYGSPHVVGVFACSSDTRFGGFEVAEPYRPMASMGADRDFLAPRISYKLNLRGPSVVVQSACSSALVCVHMACQSLLCGESELALAGAVSLALPQVEPAPLLEGGIVAPDGVCRAFDAGARGTVRGHGLGVVVLRRLADAQAHGDHIYAVIRGSAVNNDGAAKVGFSAPGPDGQAAVVAEALAVAGVQPCQVSYLEAHGTGTAVGDPLELAALNRAFAADAGGRCALGSVKTNIGHLDAAAGMAGLIKTVLCLFHGQLVPSLHFLQPNPRVDFAGGPFYVNTETILWPINESEGSHASSGATARVAGVSSFGMGGTNAHVVLEQAPPRPDPGSQPNPQPWQLVVLSARSAAALESATSRLAQHLRRHPELAVGDVAHTLQVGRQALTHRRALVAGGTREAAAALERRHPRLLTSRATPGLPVTFMFSGLGDQQLNMGRRLYRVERHFTRELDRCARLLLPMLGLDLRQALYPEGDQTPDAAAPDDQPTTPRWPFGGGAHEQPRTVLDDTAVAHAALFSLGHALARMWIAHGLEPREMIGYSIGEYVAACVAGIFTLEDALELVVRRARLVQQLPAGAMTAVPLPAGQLRPQLDSGLHLAGFNGPTLCVVSGGEADIQRLERRLADQGLASMRLRATHAFHSPQMEPAARALARLIARLRPRAPEIPCLSNLTGTWITDRQAADPRHWADQMTHPVRFSDGITELARGAPSLLLELGPAQTLCSLATLTLRGAGQHGRPVVPSLAPGSPPGGHLDALARIWLAGCDVRWPGRGRRVPLPTYPFERQYYTPLSSQPGRTLEHDLDVVDTAGPVTRADAATPYRAPSTEQERALVACWERAFGLQRVGVDHDFIDLGGHSLLAVQMLHDLRRSAGLDLSPRDLLAHPTIATLAARAGQRGAWSAEPGPVEVLEQVRRFVAQGLGCDEAALDPRRELSRRELEQALPHLLWAIKRTWELPLYAHEVLAHPSASALARLVCAELSRAAAAPEPTSDPRQLDRRLASTAEQATRSCGQLPSLKNEPVVLILSSARSGSTLLRVMLAGHPQLFCPPEMHLLMYQDLAQRRAGLPSEHFGRGLQRALDELLAGSKKSTAELLGELGREAPTQRVYATLQQLARPRLLVDKSPSYAASAATLCRAEELFEAPRYILLARHPLAVMESHLRNRMAALGAGDLDPLDAAEYHWASHYGNALEFLQHVPPRRQHRLQFEQLVRRPRRAMEQLCAFLQVPFDEATLCPYQGRRMIDGPGDPSFLEHQGIDASMADAWRRMQLPRPLSRDARMLARRLGYQLDEDVLQSAFREEW